MSAECGNKTTHSSHRDVKKTREDRQGCKRTDLSVARHLIWVLFYDTRVFLHMYQKSPDEMTLYHIYRLIVVSHIM